MKRARCSSLLSGWDLLNSMYPGDGTEVCFTLCSQASYQAAVGY
jgi:hypothetical protein